MAMAKCVLENVVFGGVSQGRNLPTCLIRHILQFIWRFGKESEVVFYVKRAAERHLPRHFQMQGFLIFGRISKLLKAGKSSQMLVAHLQLNSSFMGCILLGVCPSAAHTRLL